MSMDDILFDYFRGQCELAALGRTHGCTGFYDMLANIYPNRQSPSFWPEGWNPPNFLYSDLALARGWHFARQGLQEVIDAL